MDEPISYAMRNTEALSNWLNFNAPSELKDWSFLAIEFILVVGTICTILHAVRHYKENGNYSALLTLLGAFGYGLLCDIASYYTVENFWHGEFSVMLVYNRLPLYIALFGFAGSTGRTGHLRHLAFEIHHSPPCPYRGRPNFARKPKP